MSLLEHLPVPSLASADRQRSCRYTPSQLARCYITINSVREHHLNFQHSLNDILFLIFKVYKLRENHLKDALILQYGSHLHTYAYLLM